MANLYTIFWVGGEVEVLSGKSLEDAMGENGYHNDAKKAISFHLEGDHEEEYSYDEIRGWEKKGEKQPINHRDLGQKFLSAPLRPILPHHGENTLPSAQKILTIESQTLEGHSAALLLSRLLEIAKEAGYTHVHDAWGHNAWDEYTIEEALKHFVPENLEDEDHPNLES